MSQRKRIIGIDPGLRCLGWGIIDAIGSRLIYVADGFIAPKSGRTMEDRLLEINSNLISVLEEWQPSESAIEQVFVNKDAQSTLKLGQARGVAILSLAQKGLKVSEYAPNRIKKSVTGSGHAEKSQVKAMIEILLPKCKPKNSDSTDALAIAITHAHNYNSCKLKAQYDKVINL